MMLHGDSLLKALRKWRGKTQVDLASSAGIAQSYISDLESGRKAGRQKPWPRSPERSRSICAGSPREVTPMATETSKS